MRDINYIVKHCIDSTKKVNNFGINDINFEIVNSEETSRGMTIHLEAQGTTTARNADHIKAQLRQLMDTCKRPLAEKNIHMQCLYNQLDVAEAANENIDEPAVGLMRKYKFTVICAAVLTK